MFRITIEQQRAEAGPDSQGWLKIYEQTLDELNAAEIVATVNGCEYDPESPEP